MLAWIPQTYAYVPGVANVRVYEEPVASGLLPAVPSAHLTLWVGLSLFVQVTFVPAFTVRLAGANEKFWIVMAFAPAVAAWLAAALAAGLSAALAPAALDAGLAGAFVLAGVPLSTAAAISLLTRLATYWFEVLVCVPVALRFGYKEFLTKYFGG